MASAGPMLAGMFASRAVSQIGKNQGWSPVLTGLLSTVAGAGAGSIGAGIGAAATPAASGATSSLFAPGTTAGTATLGGITQPSAGGLLGGQSASLMPTPTATLQGSTSLFDNTVSPSLSAVTSPTMDPVMVGGKASAIKDAWNRTWSDSNFQQTLGAQVIDGLFAEEPPLQHQATGGGGGGGGSSPLGSPYQGGNGVSGQYKLVSAMPGRAQGIQWKGI